MIRENDFDVFDKTLYEIKRVQKRFMYYQAPELLKAGWQAYGTETYRADVGTTEYILFRRAYDIDKKLEEFREQKRLMEEEKKQREEERLKNLPWWLWFLRVIK